LYHPDATNDTWRVKFVPRLQAGIRTSLKKRGETTQRIELVRQPMERRYWFCRGGRYSAKVPNAAATQVAERMGS
jgi:hypothetical protein